MPHGPARTVPGTVRPRDHESEREELLKQKEGLERRAVECTEESERRAGQLRRLALDLTNAEERERSRIAGLLQDDLQQILVGLEFKLQALRLRLHAGDRAAEIFSSIESLIAQCEEKTRALSHDLSPPTLRRQGLPPALAWLAREMSRSYGLTVAVHAEPGAEPCSPDIANAASLVDDGLSSSGRREEHTVLRALIDDDERVLRLLTEACEEAGYVT